MQDVLKIIEALTALGTRMSADTPQPQTWDSEQSKTFHYAAFRSLC